MFEFIAGLVMIPAAFYSLIVVGFLAIALGIDNDRGEGWGWATIGSAILLLLGCSYFGVTFQSIKSAPAALAIGAGGYLVIGVLWSFAKWYFKLSSVRDAYLELKARYVESVKPAANFLTKPMAKDLCTTKEDAQARDELIDTNVAFFKHVLDWMHVYNTVSKSEVAEDPAKITQAIKPMAARHKSSITQWIAFWPISFAWTMINDPVRKIANYIFSRIKGTFQRMSDSMFAGV